MKMNGTEINHSMNIALCGFCQKSTEHVCQRCGDFYCSPECQRKDWQRHRYICFAVPALVHSKEFYALPQLQATQGYLNGGVGNYSYNAANANGLQQFGQQPQMELQRQMLQQNRNMLNSCQPPQQPQQQKQIENIVQRQQPYSLGNSALIPPLLYTFPHSPLNKNQHQQQAQQNQNQRPNQSLTNNNKQQQKQQNQSPNKNNNNNNNKNLSSKDNKSQPPPPQLHNDIQQPTTVAGACPKNNSRVIVTGFRYVNRCSVRELSTINNVGFADTMEMVNAAGKFAKKILSPKIDQFGLSLNQGCWHRVQIISYHKNNLLRVLFIDFGFTMLRKLNEIYEITKEVLMLPKYSFQVQLTDVPNCILNGNLLDWLKAFTNLEYKIVFNDGEKTDAISIPKVELLNWETNASLNEKLRQHCSGFSQRSDSTMTLHDDVLKEEQAQQNNIKSESSPVQEKVSSTNEQPNTVAVDVVETNTTSTASPSQPQSSLKSDAISILDKYIKSLVAGKPETTTSTNDKQEPPVLEPPFRIKKLSVEANNIDVFVVDNSHLRNGTIGCVALADGNILSQTQHYLKSFSDNVPYTPVKEEYVIAKYENEWYRAKVLEVNSVTKTCEICLIDFTNEANIGFDLIRRYPKSFTVECVTNLCHIANLPTLKEVHVKFLENKLQTNSFMTVDRISVKQHGGSDFLSLELKELIKEFNDNFLEI